LNRRILDQVDAAAEDVFQSFVQRQEAIEYSSAKRIVEFDHEIGVAVRRGVRTSTRTEQL
jgi:hypothetical protein